jgi:hypothetical protein
MDFSPESTLRDCGGETVADDKIIPQLREFLSIEAWARRDIPEPEKLLGSLVTKTTRLFLVGSTGLGKTMFGFAIAEGIASGQGFLHWRSARAARVLYIDGEMASDLIKSRSIDARRRAELASKSGMLVIYSTDFEEKIGAIFPNLGRMPPLNTEEGHSFMLRLVDAIGGVDVVIFDNVMSLLTGVQRDEETWSAVQPLVQKLSERSIGQIWFDHTGHDKTRQYGASTKAWRFDSVGVMTALPDDQRQPREVAFSLSFEPPAGKARRRTPENWADFDTTIIRLADDRWSSNVAEATSKPVKAKVAPMALEFHRALLDALACSSTPGQVTRDDWYREAARLGLVDEPDASDSHAKRDTKRKRLRKYIGELKAAGWIGVDGETVRNLVLGGTN